MTPTIKLEDLIERGIEHGKKIVMEGGEVSPLLTFAIHSKTGDGIVAVPVPTYGNPAMKETTRAGMRAILDEMGAYAYVFICEAWFQKFDPKTDDVPDADYRPSKDPYRLEAITASGADLSGRKQMRMIEIKRTKSGKAKFEEFQPPEHLDVEGEVLNLLPKRTMQ